ncbi:hypothetical protein C1H46_025250 [Malus baccata]|uniref:Uncharacterized protein n=1 Tax=Malus baccata TaxID=106549 RepID=A0A540LRV3_MALBA|nr:hypothetical protein C1H46_025250 [Malus baccata]
MLKKKKLFLWFTILYELPWILKLDYGFVEYDDGAWDFLSQLERKLFILWWDKFHLDHLKPDVFKAKRTLPDRQCAIEPSRSTPKSSSSTKIEKLSSLIESSPSCSKKDLKDKVLKILELDGLDVKETKSEVVSSHHNMDKDYGDDNEDNCYGICPSIRNKA